MSVVPPILVMHTRLREMTPAEHACIAPDELQRVRSIGSRHRQQEFLCGRSLLRFALERWTGEPAASHRLEMTDEGKPLCIDGPAVSLTHSGDFVACAVAGSGEIGIDLEISDLRRRTKDIARRYFSKEEAGWLGTQHDDRFYMLWVLKEAYSKALGCGLRGLDYLRCRVEPPNIEVSATDGSLQGLGLYKMGQMFLALAVRHATLSDVRFEHWVSGKVGPLPCNDFQIIATAADLV